jgi:hypothetical protein
MPCGKLGIALMTSIAEYAEKLEGIATRLKELPGDIRLMPVGGGMLLEYEGTALGRLDPFQMELVIYGHENGESRDGRSDESLQHDRCGDRSEV